MTKKLQNIMYLFTKIIQSRVFMASARMSMDQHHRRDYSNTRGRGRLLNLLSENDGLTNAQITELLDIRPSSVSSQVSALEDDGYIERRESEEDKRVTLIYLTDKGRNFIKNAQENTNELTDKIFTNLTDDELNGLQNSLEKIINNLDNVDLQDDFKNELFNNMKFYQNHHNNHRNWKNHHFPW